MMIKDVKWQEPVIITLQNGMHRRFQSVYDAYDFLMHEWALPIGHIYQDALRACIAVLNDNGCGEAARRAFVAVSRSQNCLLEAGSAA
jgi:hypothetical protein